MFDTSPQLDCAGSVLKLDRPRVMGIVNVTPDSFSDGGEHASLEDAVAHGLRLAGEGADILDVGGESTRPGAEAVPLQQELDRVVPVIEALRAELPAAVSVDTSKPEVMRAAVAAGAGLINDVRALREPGALAAAVDAGVPVCLMHMQGEPRSMQQQPQYTDVVAEVRDFLLDRAAALEAAGVDRERIVLDPGFGFGKTVEHNCAMLRELRRFGAGGLPVLAGLSRKSMLGAITGRPVEQRVSASVAAALIAVQRGAAIVRVHDVAATRDALAVWQAVS